MENKCLQTLYLKLWKFLLILEVKFQKVLFLTASAKQVLRKMCQMKMMTPSLYSRVQLTNCGNAMRTLFGMTLLTKTSNSWRRYCNFGRCNDRWTNCSGFNRGSREISARKRRRSHWWKEIRKAIDTLVDFSMLTQSGKIGTIALKAANLFEKDLCESILAKIPKYKWNNTSCFYNNILTKISKLSQELILSNTKNKNT